MDRETLLSIAKPILFNTKMVRAIMEGRKTQTRRVIKRKGYDGKIHNQRNDYQYKRNDGWWDIGYRDQARGWPQQSIAIKPRYQPGDILYVRETWTEVTPFAEDGTWDYDNAEIFYKANPSDEARVDAIDYYDDNGFPLNRPFPWRPSIHMPKEAARIFLKVTDVRAERLQDMTTKEVIMEGINTDGLITAFGPIDYRIINIFEELWNSTIKKKELDLYGYAANPWVWVIEFELLEVTNG